MITTIFEILATLADTLMLVWFVTKILGVSLSKKKWAVLIPSSQFLVQLFFDWFMPGYSLLPMMIMLGFVFTFAMILSPKLRAKVLKCIIDSADAALTIYNRNPYLLCLHDGVNTNENEYRVESAKLLATTMYFLKGTPFIYQGQEIGMSNWYPSDPNMYEDVQTRWQYFNVATKKSPEKRLERLWHGSRDSSRTPVQWDDSENAGFSKQKPWFYVNENYKEVNVKQQESDSESVLNFYRKAIKLRKELSAVKYGNYKEYNKCSSKVYTYLREDDKQKILVVCSYYSKETSFNVPKDFDITSSKLVLTNYNNNSLVLKPYECRVYVLEK